MVIRKEKKYIWLLRVRPVINTVIRMVVPAAVRPRLYRYHTSVGQNLIILIGGTSPPPMTQLARRGLAFLAQAAEFLIGKRSRNGVYIFRRTNMYGVSLYMHSRSVLGIVEQQCIMSLWYVHSPVPYSVQKH